jgi:membrane protein CcdC involved in cytochrome C biogenesis
MPFFKILSATPLWVFFVFAYLMFVGIRATKDREIHIEKMFLMPCVFFTMFLAKLIQTWRIDIWLIFSATLLISFVVCNFFVKQEQLKIKKSHVFVKGSCETLVIVMIIFCVKYFFGYMKAVNGESEKYLIAEIIFSGITTSFFLNKVIRYARLIGLKQ